MAILKGSAGGKEPRSAGVVAVGVDGRRVLVRVILVHELIIPLLEREKYNKKMMGGGLDIWFGVLPNQLEKKYLHMKCNSKGYDIFCKALLGEVYIRQLLEYNEDLP